MSRDTEALWLRPNVVAEPLVNQRYAWPYLISPMTAPFACGERGIPAGLFFGRREIVIGEAAAEPVEIDEPVEEAAP